MRVCTDELLAPVKQVIAPKEVKDRVQVFHVYAVRVQNRNQVLRRLSDRGIVIGCVASITRFLFISR